MTRYLYPTLLPLLLILAGACALPNTALRPLASTLHKPDEVIIYKPQG